MSGSGGCWRDAHSLLYLCPHTFQALSSTQQIKIISSKPRSDCLELPLPFASALAAQLLDARRRREKATTTGRFAWVEKLLAGAAKAAAPAAAPADATQGAAAAGRSAQPAADGTATPPAAAAGPQQQQKQQQQQQEEEQQPSRRSDLTAQGFGVEVRVSQLEEVFTGAIQLEAQGPAGASLLGGSLRPLQRSANQRGQQQQRHRHKHRRGGGLTAEAAVAEGRPLSAVIAAANAELRGWVEKRAAAGLSQLCARMERAAGSSSAAAAAAAGSSGAPRALAGSSGGDVCTVLALLRRLQLWPADVETLKATGAGKRVGQLRRHANPVVAALASSVVNAWRAQLEVASAAAAAASAAAAKRKSSGIQRQSSGGSEGQAAAAAAAVTAAAAEAEAHRGKARRLLVNALRDHLRAVQQEDARQRRREEEQKKVAEEEDKSMSSPKGAAAEPPPSESELAALAAAVEEALFDAATLKSGRGGGGGGGGGSAGGDGAAAAAAAAARLAGGGWKAPYSSRVKAVAAALRHADGVACQLLTGQLAPAAVPDLSSEALAPAALRRAAEEREAARRRAEAAWEELMASGGVGGGGTHVSYDRPCPACAEKRCQIHVCLTGGTYAIERFEFQKCVCLECGHTWRVDV